MDFDGKAEGEEASEVLTPTIGRKKTAPKTVCGASFLSASHPNAFLPRGFACRENLLAFRFCRTKNFVCGSASVFCPHSRKKTAQ
jgi:hypothetical protein